MSMHDTERLKRSTHMTPEKVFQKTGAMAEKNAYIIHVLLNEERAMAAKQYENKNNITKIERRENVKVKQWRQEFRKLILVNKWTTEMNYEIG